MPPGCKAAAIWSRSGFDDSAGGCRQVVARRLALHCAGAQPSRPCACWSCWRAAGRGSGASARRRSTAIRSSALARGYVYFFALAPGVCAIAIAFASGTARTARPRRAAWSCCPDWRSLSPPATRCCSIASGWCRRPGLGLLFAPPALVVLGLVDLAVDVRRRSQDRAAGQCRRPFLRRQFPAPHRQAAELCHRRYPHRAAGRARRAEPAARLFRLGAAAQSVGQPRRFLHARRHAGLAGDRQRRHAAASAQDAVSRPGAGSAALVSAHGARRVAAHPPRLGGAAARNELSDSSRLRAPCRGTANR